MERGFLISKNSLTLPKIDFNDWVTDCDESLITTKNKAMFIICMRRHNGQKGIRFSMNAIINRQLITEVIPVIKTRNSSAAIFKRIDKEFA